MNIIGLISAKAWGYVAAAIAVLVAVAKIFYAGKKSAQVDGMKEQLQNVKTRDQVDASINTAPDPERDKLRAKWQRD